MNPDNMHILESVKERDIDLLVLEEIHCSEEFRRWFLKNTAGTELANARFQGAWHSIYNSAFGESDIEAEFTTERSGVLRLLIENKIDAAPQPEQAVRYRMRGKEYIEKGLCSTFVTVLIAPKDYLGTAHNAAEYDSTVSYEDIRQWFTSRGPGVRDKYRAGIMTLAIEEARRGYHPEKDDPVTDFWLEYWKLASTEAPELSMQKPGPKPRGAGFIAFKPESMPRGMKIVHKLAFGNLDLELDGLGGQVQRLEEYLKGVIESDMIIASANKSAAIRIKVPELDTSHSLDEQRDYAIEGLSAAKRLLAWTLKNRGEIESISADND